MIKPKRRNLQEINSSSMADIAFLLLVFFLVTTTISMDKGINIILPSDANQEEVNKKNLVNILVNQSRVKMGNDRLSINDIARKAKKLIKENPKVIFSVKTTEETKYKSYLEVLDQLKLAGAEKISIAN